MSKKSPKAIEGEVLKREHAGQPTKYLPDHCNFVLDLLKQGKTKSQIAAMLGVSTKSLDRWEKEHEEFALALEVGKSASEARWTEIGFQGMTGQIKGFNPTMFIFMTSNMFGWRQRTDGTNVQVNITNSSTSMTDEELDEKIKRLESKISVDDDK